MNVDFSRIGQHLSFIAPVGTRMSLKEPLADRSFWTVFLGMEKDRFLILRYPREAGAWCAEGGRVVVRYVDRNLIFGFSATVLHLIRTPFSLLFLDSPASVESLDLRSHDRAFCYLPMTIYLQGEQELPAHLIDLSRGGCRLAIDATVAGPRLSGLKEGGSFFSQFVLDGPEPVYAGCEIRNLATDRQRLFLGARFTDLPEQTGQRIEAYVRRINDLFPARAAAA